MEVFMSLPNGLELLIRALEEDEVREIEEFGTEVQGFLKEVCHQHSVDPDRIDMIVMLHPESTQYDQEVAERFPSQIKLDGVVSPIARIYYNDACEWESRLMPSG
jgi:hypothetical protein